MVGENSDPSNVEEIQCVAGQSFFFKLIFKFRNKGWFSMEKEKRGLIMNKKCMH